MTQVEKQLLIKDLCARVPYTTFVYVKWHETEKLEICEEWEYDEEEPNVHTLIYCDYYGECNLDGNLHKTIYDIKPYLRPMSSMTEEERNEYLSIKMQETERVALAEICRPEAISEIIDWLNSRYFDYRGLIQKGLALEAPFGMYK